MKAFYRLEVCKVEKGRHGTASYEKRKTNTGGSTDLLHGIFDGFRADIRAQNEDQGIGELPGYRAARMPNLRRQKNLKYLLRGTEDPK